MNFQQKLFAVIEGMVKETDVKDIPLHVPAAVETLDYTIDMDEKIHPMDFSVSTAVDEIEPAIPAQIVEIVEQLTQPGIEDAALSDLQADVVDEKVDTIICPALLEADTHLGTETKDFFKTFNVDKKLKYDTAVKGVDIAKLKPRTQIHNAKFTIRPVLKDNLPFFKRFTVNKKPVVLSFLGEREQLHYWKKAVEKTRKDVKKLKMVGIYTAVPRGSTENLKINFSTKSLNYNFKESFSLYKKEEPVQDLGLFEDLETGKSIMVNK